MWRCWPRIRRSWPISSDNLICRDPTARDPIKKPDASRSRCRRGAQPPPALFLDFHVISLVGQSFSYFFTRIENIIGIKNALCFFEQRVDLVAKHFTKVRRSDEAVVVFAGH